MKVAYIAHPISGDVPANLARILEIVRRINLNEKDVVPFVPYYADCLALDDSNAAERARGLANGLALIGKRFIDEIWLYGPTITGGMHQEIAAARKYGIAVVPKSLGTLDEWQRITTTWQGDCFDVSA